MAAVQTQALTSHLRARDTRKVNRVGGGLRKHLLLCYTYFHTAAQPYIQHIQYLLLCEQGKSCSNIYYSASEEEGCRNTDTNVWMLKYAEV